MKKIIHVNQHIIRRNQKSDFTYPPLLVKTYKGSTHAMEIEIKGPCRVVYRPDKPLKCGARVWIETESEVEAK